MQIFPGKLDCTRRTPQRRSPAAYNLLLGILLCLSTAALTQTSTQFSDLKGAAPQPDTRQSPGGLYRPTGAPAASVTPYPEVAWLGRSTYCNPYFGFRLALPRELKIELIYLPVQPDGRHMLLALHLSRLDRSANLFISAFEDGAQDPALLAAKARIQQARSNRLSASGPHKLKGHQQPLYRLRIANPMGESGDESSYFFTQRGYVVHAAVFSHEENLAAAIGSALERLEFFDPAPDACTPPPANDAPSHAASVAAYPPALAADAASLAESPATSATGSVTALDARVVDPKAVAAAPRLYYGPALPTGLVESLLREQPGKSVPGGQFSHGTFVDSALGIRVQLPPGWKPMPVEDSYRVAELMRDPVADRESSDRRRELFRACSRVLFAAADPRTELTAPASVTAPAGPFPPKSAGGTPSASLGNGAFCRVPGC